MTTGTEREGILDDAPAEPWPSLPRARRLRLVATVCSVLWMGSLGTFVVLVGSRVEDRVLSALGVLASVFFATSFIATSAADRREVRALEELAERSDLVAATRPPRRLRGYVARETTTVGPSRPGARRDRTGSRPPR